MYDVVLLTLGSERDAPGACGSGGACCGGATGADTAPTSQTDTSQTDTSQADSGQADSRPDRRSVRRSDHGCRCWPAPTR